MFPSYVEVDAPQQQNGNDCGMYVLAVAAALCRGFSGSRQITSDLGGGSADTAAAATWKLSEQHEADLLQHITPAAVQRMRQDLLKIIEHLAAETGSG